MKTPHYYRLIVTYSGFSESKDDQVTASARRSPSQTSYSPVEARRSLDYVFNSRQAAGAARTRIVALQQKIKGFSLSKVIDDNS